MTGVSTRHAYTQPVIPAPAYKSAPFHHSTLHTLRLKTEVLVLTSHIFTAHIQSICKPHLSTFRTSWVWPFITTSLLQAIIFPHLKDCNSFLTGLPVLHTSQMIFPWFKLVHAMPLLKTFQWRPKALTQHDLTLSLLVLSSVLWFPFSAQATERSAHWLTKLVSTSGPLHLLPTTGNALPTALRMAASLPSLRDLQKVLPWPLSYLYPT